ncbi:MAG: SGNH/GDSL hydrolase family protein [Candidatus Krumholzibacteria bacterium]|nr:SGNH/GDSL hydrolase family protein [Candidatus Krumholzibacteria bacterium]
MGKSSIPKSLLLSVVSFAVVFVVAELATRLIFESNTVLNVNIGGFKAYHPTRRTQLKKNYHRGRVSINSHGVSGPEFSIEPEPKTARVLAIGNSVTFSPAPRNYPRVLEEQLRASFPNGSIEVIAGAVPGYSSYDALDWYNEFLHRLNADITLIMLGWNDMGQYHPFGLRYKVEALYQHRTLLGRLMERFYVLRVPYFFAGRLERSRPINRSALTPAEERVMGGFVPTHFEKNLEELITRSRADGSEVYLTALAGLLAYPPTDEELERLHFPRNTGRKLALYQAIYDAYVASLDRVAARTNTPIIDLRELIRTPEDRLIYRDAMHVNEEGAVRYATYIAEAVRPAVEALLASKRRDAALE